MLVEYQIYIKVVLDIFYKLIVNKDKSKVYIIVFLGQEISSTKVYIELSKIEAIWNQPIPINIIEVQGLDLLTSIEYLLDDIAILFDIYI